MTPQVWWYLARSAGVVAWALVAVSVVWGLLVSTRSLSKRPGRGWVLEMHRFLGTLSVVFTGIHMAGLVADSYVHFGLVELLVPFASEWRPAPVAYGIVAFYLLLAVQVTSLVQRRLPRRVWRSVHMLSFPLYLIGTVHLFTAGTDAGSPLLQWAAWASVVLVLFLVTFRLLVPRRRPVPRPA